jgi:hypothetical protein
MLKRTLIENCFSLDCKIYIDTIANLYFMFFDEIMTQKGRKSQV